MFKLNSWKLFTSKLEHENLRLLLDLDIPLRSSSHKQSQSQWLQSLCQVYSMCIEYFTFWNRVPDQNIGYLFKIFKLLKSNLTISKIFFVAAIFMLLKRTILLKSDAEQVKVRRHFHYFILYLKESCEVSKPFVPHYDNVKINPNL